MCDSSLPHFLGYEVSEATGGEGALSILADVKPDMMIVDFAMGGLTGAETALAARQRYPGIPVLFISGFADTEALRSAVGIGPLIHKPFRPAELAVAVRSIWMRRLCRSDAGRFPWVARWPPACHLQWQGGLAATGRAKRAPRRDTAVRERPFAWMSDR